MPLLIFIPIILIFVLVIRAAAQKMKAVQAAWARAAGQLGLTHSGSTFSPMRMDGSIGGLGIAVDVYSTGGKNKTQWTRYRAVFPRPNTAVRLKRQTGLSRVTKFFGATDVEVGDSTFDDAFIIKADSEQHAGEFLTPERRTLLLRLYSLYRGVDLSPDHLEIVTRGYEDSSDALVTTTRRLVSAGRLLAGMHDDGGRMREALSRRAAGDMAAAAEALRSAAATTEDLEESIVAADLLAGSGRVDEARPLLDRLATQLPADEEIAGLRRAVDRMQPATPAPGVDAVEMQEILDDLFVSNRLSFETTEVFDEHYLGREISWNGRLKSARDYNNDLDFGKGPASKLVVAIAEVEHDLYGVSEVDAVVSVPKGSAAHLKRGDLVSFTGKLLKADSMMRNIFVRSGRLL